MPPGAVMETFIIAPELSLLEKIQLWHLVELNWAEKWNTESMGLIVESGVPQHSPASPETPVNIPLGKRKGRHQKYAE